MTSRRACCTSSCVARRAHFERPDEPRGVQYVEVDDGYEDDRVIFCSFECAGYAGFFTARSDKSVFVFGSNLLGRHGAGAALSALESHGAQLGQGVGRQGQSYGIPTKDTRLRPLALTVISGHVNTFLDYAVNQPDLRFQVTRVGCGLAGYRDEDIAPMFHDAPENCAFFSLNWQRIIRRERT